MDQQQEAKEIDEVIGRLAERFPHLDHDTIEIAVRQAHAEMTGNIRDFVPVLVEHTARDRLAESAAVGEDAGATPTAVLETNKQSGTPAEPPQAAESGPHGSSTSQT
ncbi:three-helix bundle dimerization domain-containing protein [Monashia sp. NPDC004114]